MHEGIGYIGRGFRDNLRDIFAFSAPTRQFVHIDRKLMDTRTSYRIGIHVADGTVLATVLVPYGFAVVYAFSRI